MRRVALYKHEYLFLIICNTIQEYISPWRAGTLKVVEQRLIKFAPVR